MVGAAEPALALRLAEWTATLEWRDVPEAQRALTRLRILDTLGLILAVLDTAPARAALAVAAAQGGVEESTVIGAGRRLPATWAALAHATLAHCRDFDDTFAESVVHPGSVVVPVALAVGEATAADGGDVLAAIAAGYEASARLGAAGGRKFHARGLHSTGTIGPLAAAVTAARLYGLAPLETAQAMGLAGSMSGGLMEFLADGAWSKWLHTGWAAHGGVLAAQLARRGFFGPVTVLDGRHGVFNALIGPGEADLSAVARGLGAEWRGGEAHFKYYPCAHVMQPFIDTALDLRREHAIDMADVAEVVCTMASWGVPIVCEPWEEKLRPASELAAVASLPVQLAAALLDGRVTLATLAPENLARADLREAARRVRYVVDPALGAGFDGGLAIVMRDGARFERPAVADGRNAAKVRAKFRGNAARSLPDEAVSALEAAVDDADFSLARLTALFGV